MKKFIDYIIKPNDKNVFESIKGFGKFGTIQIFGNDVIITDKKQRSISLSKQDTKDLINKLKEM